MSIITEEEREERRRKYGGEFEILPIDPDFEFNGETVGEVADIIIRRGGHKTFNPNPKKSTTGIHTMVTTHGWDPYNEERRLNNWKLADEIINLTKRSEKSNDLLLLSICFFNDDLAEHIAINTNRDVVYFGENLEMGEHIDDLGDCSLHALNDTQSLKKLSIDESGKVHIEKIGYEYIVSRTAEMSRQMAAAEQQQTSQQGVPTWGTNVPPPPPDGSYGQPQPLPPMATWLSQFAPPPGVSTATPQGSGIPAPPFGMSQFPPPPEASATPYPGSGMPGPPFGMSQFPPPGASAAQNHVPPPPPDGSYGQPQTPSPWIVPTVGAIKPPPPDSTPPQSPQRSQGASAATSRTPLPTAEPKKKGPKYVSNDPERSKWSLRPW